ncbi:putative glycoside hydrolase [Gaiella sp.]|uniref:putative glycoside hydrolase n=1 Tax=Gaiella sp. TaxID=2663207 RepID=UPI003264FC1D
MDAERYAEMVRWATALERSETAELRAAGRAIRALCEENRALADRLSSSGGGSGPSGLPDGQRARRAAGGANRPHPGSRRTRGLSRWSLSLTRLGVSAAVLAVAAAGALVVVRAAAPALQVTGPPSNTALGSSELAALAFKSAQRGTRWELDGREVHPALEGGMLVLRPGALSDGNHTLVVRRDARLFRSSRRSFSFVVDTTAPTLRLDGPAVVNAGRPLAIRGVVEPGATLALAGQRVSIDAEGRFSFSRPIAPASLTLVARDAAGNASRWRVPVTVIPRRPAEPIRAVHVTAYGWADATLRAGVMRLIDERRINAVELDLKDEGGEVGWNAPVPLARQMGAALRIFDLKEAVARLHAKGIRVIGRLVCFRDPIHASAAWKAGRRDEVVQTPQHGPYAAYGGFTNPASPAVRKYNIDIALAAADAGVDEILYDYVRRPDGPIASMVFPGLRTTPEKAIVGFLTESRRALSKSGVFVGASVFGIAATRPTEVAQDIPEIARRVDYVAPMVYPSHWGPGEYDVANPNASPYEIVARSLADFQKQVRGTGARVVPWLQDFSLGYTYGPAEVADQIRAAREAGSDEFLLWNAAVTYTSGALGTTAKVPALGQGTSSAVSAPGPVRLPDLKPAKKAAAPKAAPATVVAGGGPLSGLPPNELGRVPVIMHHQIRADRVGDYDQTPAEFRAELEQLWKRGYVPIAVGQLLDGKLGLPKGTSPVVMTFDDSTREQLALDGSGNPLPGTAVGIMLDFARTHAGFTPRGTFYINRDPFGVQDGARLIRWLTANGFELGNHTRDHLPLRTLDNESVQRQLVLGAAVITDALPGYRIRSMALPLGSMPKRERLAVGGSWQKHRYGPYGVLLVGANPAPSPFGSSFDRAAIPRIRSSHLPFSVEDELGFSYWLADLDRNPASRYVSDGDARTITAPAAAKSELAPRYRQRFVARP